MKERVSLNFKPESMNGIISVGIFAAQIVIFGGCVVYSTYRHGNAGVLLGIVCVLIPLLSIGGIGVAINGIMKKECTHKLARIGLLLNILALVSMITVYITGVFQLL